MLAVRILFYSAWRVIIFVYFREGFADVPVYLQMIRVPGKAIHVFSIYIMECDWIIANFVNTLKI